MDEKPYQLLDEVREPIPISPGKPRKIDAEYVRKATCSILVYSEPLTGWRMPMPVSAVQKMDWAMGIRWLLEEAYPKVIKVRLVSDNLNTHALSSLYEAIPSDKAKEIPHRLEMHHTLKHGSCSQMNEFMTMYLTSDLNKQVLHQQLD